MACNFLLYGDSQSMLHKNAMLVVVGYSHLTCKLEFDRFRTTLHKNAMLVVWYSHFAWKFEFHRFRTTLHKNAMLVVVWYSHWTWKLEFDRFLFQLKLFM